MELRTYTSLWQVEKRIYSIYDFSLPFPVPVKVLGPFFLVGLPTWLILNVLGVPFSTPFLYLFYIVPPCAAGFLSTRHIAEGKKVGQLVSSYTKHFFEPKQFSRLRSYQQPTPTVVFVDVWHTGAPVVTNALNSLASEQPETFKPMMHTSA